ncbi:hypothetical protein SDC9_91349 [bioreactor metagenome]|uniref:Uncharacterized protein n=1 Tax=bioreactor metagenome TaxID=1076179 RepID=A0A644ZUM4_9ZZZZ
MSKNTIIIEQLLFCNSYEEALGISKAFDRFHFQFMGLGGKNTVYSKRFINKSTTSKCYTHYVKICFTINYYGEFMSYGFLDERTKNKYPNLPSLLKAEDVDRRRKIISKYRADDLFRDIYFYEDFKKFFDKSLKGYLNKIYLSEIIAFADYFAKFFVIRYQEQGVAYEMDYSATSSFQSIYAKKYAIDYDLKPMQMSSVWKWINENYYSKKDDWYSEARPLTTFSYVINRLPFE